MLRLHTSRRLLCYLLASSTSFRVHSFTFLRRCNYSPSVLVASSSSSPLSTAHFQRYMSSFGGEGLADIGRDTDNHTTSSVDNPMSSTVSLTGSSWRQLLEISSNRSRKIRGSNYVQLATVENGLPRCRTVVFRGFAKLPAEHPQQASTLCDNLPCFLKMITDARSQKVAQVDQQDRAEMVWWFPKTSEQYRIRGQLVLVGAPSSSEKTDDGSSETHVDADPYWQILRREQWGNLRDGAREAFYDPRQPGDPWMQDDQKDAQCQIPTGGRDAETGHVLQPPPEHYLLMLLIPDYCDYLRLGSDEQYRQIDERLPDGTWTSQRVNP